MHVLLIFVLAVGCACGGDVGAPDRFLVQRAEQRDVEEEQLRWDEDFNRRLRGPERGVVVPIVMPTPRPQRKIRRFQWESPAETRGKLWNVPEEESEKATLTALLRVCIAEADGHPQDCVGIWQVVKNNRRRTCNRGMIRRITECVEGEGETFLSALRRHQRHVLGIIKARNKRAVWISKLTTECEPPEGFPGTLDQWDARYQQRCSQVVADGRYLIKGELPPSRPGHHVKWLPGRPVTWGGRCETGKAACDDRIACARGLIRIQDSDTLNAFWRRPQHPGEVEPICRQMGYAGTVPAESPVAVVEASVIASPGG